MWDIAYAQAAPRATGPGPVMYLFSFVLIFIIMYFLVIRPQQKKATDHILATAEKKDWFWENRKFIGASTLLVPAFLFFVYFIHPEHEAAMHVAANSQNISVGFARLIVFFTIITTTLVGLWLLLGQQPPTERTITNKKLFCNQCGERLLEEDQFCGQCGAQVS